MARWSFGAGDARVAVCPQWQGRVMTSTCGGPPARASGSSTTNSSGPGKLNPHFNNYGAEERLWLSPEGGQFSLWFKPGKRADTRPLVHPSGLQQRRMGRGLRPNDADQHDHDDEAPEHLGHGVPSRRRARRFTCWTRTDLGDHPVPYPPRIRPRTVAYRRPTIHQPRAGHDPGKGTGLDLDPGHDELRTADGRHRALRAGLRAELGPWSSRTISAPFRPSGSRCAGGRAAAGRQQLPARRSAFRSDGHPTSLGSIDFKGACSPWSASACPTTRPNTCT